MLAVTPTLTVSDEGCKTELELEFVLHSYNVGRLGWTGNAGGGCGSGGRAGRPNKKGKKRFLGKIPIPNLMHPSVFQLDEVLKVNRVKCMNG